MYDPSRYGWKKKIPNPLRLLEMKSSQVMPLYETIDAKMYTNDVFDFESGFAVIVQSISVPQTYKQVTSNEFFTVWKPAIYKEHDSLRDHTWTQVKILLKMNVFPSKYVFCMKSFRLKARLVAVGFLKVHGVY